MAYKLIVSNEFLEELEEICCYITNNLKEEYASKKFRENVMSYILFLEFSPYMFLKIEKMDRTKRQYRRIVINNYILLYTVIEEDRAVLISHIYYGGRNYLDNFYQ
jgi:mRNA-degrading endonuclease RelE of RelBE toxin-antitoxin system